VLDRASGPVTVLTAQAIEQLPTAANVVETLLRYADRIDTVYHLEPAYELQGNSLMGLLRQRYLDLNDYNRDLIGQLKRHADRIEILDIRKDAIGFNPFNALAWIKWRPRR
jgi:hypothetical protein